MNIAILGPAGSGKGTMARQLAEKGNLAIFDTGAALRAWAEKNEPELARHLGSGGMAKTALVIELLGQKLAIPPAGAGGWIIDGTPRNAEQAEEILSRRERGEFNLDIVMVLECPDEVAKERLLGRVSCERCGAPYNIKGANPPAGGVCRPSCGGKLLAREDDQPAGIKKRQHLYKELTIPGIARLLEAGVCIAKVDSSGSIPEVEGLAEAALFKSLGSKAPKWLKNRAVSRMR